MVTKVNIRVAARSLDMDEYEEYQDDRPAISELIGNLSMLC